MLLLGQVGLDILGCKEVAKKSIRDLLHSKFPEVSKDKSSTSCWARLKRLLKNGAKDRTIKLYTTIALSDNVRIPHKHDIIRKTLTIIRLYAIMYPMLVFMS